MAQRLVEKVEDQRAVRGLRAQMDEFRRRIERGEQRLGWKIALNSPEVQQRLGLTGPLIGYMTDANLRPADAPVMLPDGRLYLAEAEVALTLRSDVPAGCPEQECAEAIGAIAPAIEILDFTGAPPDPEVILARNAFHSCVVFGEERPAPPDLTMDALKLALSISGGEPRTLDPSLLVGEPAAVVRFTAGILESLGEHLRTGDRIICGSLNPPTRVRSGDTIEATISPLGSLAIELSAAR
jgi:2-keto-4-pentenoate hydratase